MNNFEQIPLRDIHLPDPVSWWPPAIGWWLLLVVIIFGAFFIWWAAKRLAARRQQRSLRRWVQQELDRIELEYKATTNKSTLLQDLSVLVRRVVMSSFPRQGVAGLCGESWATWLREADLGESLNEQSVQLLVEGPYKKDAEADAMSLLSACRQWLELVMRKQVTT